MKPFRWNIDKKNELGTLIDHNQIEIPADFTNELISSSARILAFADNSFIYFVGRSPEDYYDFLSGVFDHNELIKERLNLFQFSARFYNIGELKGNYLKELNGLKKYMEDIQLSPKHIRERKTKTAFVDVVYYSHTFNILIDILKDWALEINEDWATIKNKIRIVGITVRTKNSPNTWRWQQNVDWIDTIGRTKVKNVSVSEYFWHVIANSNYKTTKSFQPKNWNNPEVEKPPRDFYNKQGLRIAFTLFNQGMRTENKSKLREHLVKQNEIKFNWYKEYIKSL